MNATLNNAEMPGGRRNGVMTALDDFVDGYDRPLRRLVLPFYFGLAIVAEEERIAATPELAAVLDHLASAEGRQELLELSEKIRIDATVREQNWTRVMEAQIGRGAERYLDVVEAALLDEHYLENELRLEYLGNLLSGGQADLAVLRDPARQLPVRYEWLRQARIAGGSSDVTNNRAFFPYTDMGRAQLRYLRGALDSIVADDVGGDLAECGVGRGGGAIFMRAYLEAHEIVDRQVWVADPFVASEPESDPQSAGEPLDLVARLARFHANLHQVRDGFARFDLLDERIHFVQGRVEDSLADAPIGDLALLRLGESLAGSLGAALERLLPAVVPGGVVIVEGVANPAVERALGTLRGRLGVTADLERVDNNSVSWRVPAPRWDRRRAAPSVPRRWQRGRADTVSGPAGVAVGRRSGRHQRGGRLLQHAPRGGPHAALVVAVVPTRDGRRRLRGHRGRQRIRSRPAADRGGGRAPTARSSGSSTSARTRRRRPPWPSTRGSRWPEATTSRS